MYDYCLFDASSSALGLFLPCISCSCTKRAAVSCRGVNPPASARQPASQAVAHRQRHPLPQRRVPRPPTEFPEPGTPPLACNPAQMACPIRARGRGGPILTLLANLLIETRPLSEHRCRRYGNFFSSAGNVSMKTWPTMARLRGSTLSKVSPGVCQ